MIALAPWSARKIKNVPVNFHVIQGDLTYQSFA